MMGVVQVHGVLVSLGTISSVIFLHEAHWYLPVHLTHVLLFDFDQYHLPLAHQPQHDGAVGEHTVALQQD